MIKITSKNNLSKSFLLLFLFCILVYFPLFMHLGSLPIIIWDEARLALNAYEMHLNSNFIVTYFDGQPDMWNTKPPLLIWAQVFCIKLFGVNELAIRLPVAIAAFITAAFLMIFSIKYIKNYWFGIIAVLVLITTNGYVHLHAARTGDYDGFLTLFTTIYAIMFFLFIEKKKNIYLHWFFIALALAVLTKTVQGLFFIPAIFIYALFTKNLIKLLKNKFLYIDILAFLIVVLGYYFLREYFNAGYLKAVWQNDLGQRYMSAIDGHRGSFMFYFNKLNEYHYTNWLWLLPCGIFAGFFVKEERLRKISIYSTLLVITYWLIISSATTKLEWYMVPMFPFMAVLCAVIIYFVFVILKELKNINKFFIYNIIPYVFLFIVFLSPYRNTIDKIYLPQRKVLERDFYNISIYLKDAVRNIHAVKNHKICYDGYIAHLQFYINILNQRGENIVFADCENLQQDDFVIASQIAMQQFIENNYHVSEIKNHENVKTYIINGKKTVN